MIFKYVKSLRCKSVGLRSDDQTQQTNFLSVLRVTFLPPAEEGQIQEGMSWSSKGFPKAFLRRISPSTSPDEQLHSVAPYPGADIQKVNFPVRRMTKSGCRFPPYAGQFECSFWTLGESAHMRGLMSLVTLAGVSHPISYAWSTA
jgi:hypothetical protein